MRLSHERRLAFSTAVYFLMLVLFVPAAAVQGKKTTYFTAKKLALGMAAYRDFQSTTHVESLGHLCFSLLFQETFNRVCSCYFFSTQRSN